MKIMTVDEALIILGIKDRYVTKEVIKKHHRRLLSEYHPDRNPDGHEATQRINIARDFLYSHMDELRSISRPVVINVAGVKIVKECGKTVVFGHTFPLKGVFKKHGFKWSPEENVWWCYGAYPIEDALGC